MPASKPVNDETFLDRPIDRRTLIRRGLAFVGASAIVAPAFLRAVFDDASTASAARYDLLLLERPRRRVLVVLQIAGGNDGLNTVIPYADGAYYDARPDLAIAPEDTLTLDDRTALHPSLSGVRTLYDRGDAAIVLGAGYPNPNRSHFSSMDVWHTASTDGSDTGWLGRLLDATRREQDSLWRAANVGAAAPRSLRSEESFVPSLSSVPAYVVQTDPRYPSEGERRLTAWLQLYSAQASELAVQAEYGGQLALVSETGLQAYESTVVLDAATSGYAPAVEYPDTPLARALQTAAELVTSETGTGIVYVTTGGFDTHAAQADQHASLLQTIGDAVLAFHDDLRAHGMAEEVTTLAWTEFGRRVRENGSDGTDHGTAGPLFLLGGAVRGGLHGEQPSVADLDGNGDLKFSVDFRSVYSSVIAQLFDADPTDVLDGRFEELPLFTTV